MRKKVFQHAGALIIAAIILTFFTMSWAMYNNTAEQLRVSVRNECEYYRYFLDKMGDDSLDKPAGKITASRVTLIDTDGTVLFDSVEDAKMMGNHSGRPEVIEAEKTGESNISRYSETLRSKTYYTALRLDNGKIIRVSLTTDSVFGVMLRNIWLVAVLIAAVLVVELMMVSHMTKALVKPINEIDLNHPLDNKAYEELSPLLGRIHQQQKQIQQQMEELRHNQEEYLAITEYMKDGLIVTNQSVVLSINRSAQNLFDVTAEECINHNIVTVSRNEQLKEALDHALEGSSEERMLELNGRVYQLLANPVRVDNVVSGAVILVLDVTEKQKAEVMRREFSANVSHELKTPLMSISGYAEIIENNMVQLFIIYCILFSPQGDIHKGIGKVVIVEIHLREGDPFFLIADPEYVRQGYTAIGQGDPGAFPIRNGLLHPDAVQNLLRVLPVQRQNAGGAPVIKIRHIIDQCINIRLFFQVQIVGQKRAVIDLTPPGSIDSRYPSVHMHNFIDFYAHRFSLPFLHYLLYTRFPALFHCFLYMNMHIYILISSYFQILFLSPIFSYVTINIAFSII